MKPLSQQRQDQIAEIHRQGTASGLPKEKIKGIIAETFGVSMESAGRYLRDVARLGGLGTKPVLPGFELKQTSAKLDASGNVLQEWVQQRPERGEPIELPAGHVVKGVSILADGDGRVIQQWTKTREGRDPTDIAEILKASLAELPAYAEPRPVASWTVDDLLTLYPCNDWHLGMFAWGQETEANWDTKLAEGTIGDAMTDLIAVSPFSTKAVVLVGGDLLHADNQENRTAKSGNQLDVDGRYPKVLAAANRLMVRIIGAALDKHKEVTVRVLKGNHDEHSAVGVSYFLEAYYRDEPRVTVDVDPSLFWWLRFGKVLLGSTHGHTIKPDQMAGIMAARRAQDWGATKHRYAHTFHLHHKRILTAEAGGVTTEVHQAPIPQDAWHYGAGFLSGRSVQSITYHAEHGEIGRARISLLDA